MEKRIFIPLLFGCLLTAVISPVAADQRPSGVMGFQWGESVEAANRRAIEMGLTLLDESLSQSAENSSGLRTSSYIGVLSGAPGLLELKFHEGELYLLSIGYGELMYKVIYTILLHQLNEEYGTADNESMRMLDIPDANAWFAERMDIVLSMHHDSKTTLLSYADRVRLTKALADYRLDWR